MVTVISGTDTVDLGSTWTDTGATGDGGETVTASGTVGTSEQSDERQHPSSHFYNI